MEKPSEAAQSESSIQLGEPSPTGPPTLDQAMVETMPILHSNPIPISATPWILDHPSSSGLSSITVPVRLDVLNFLLNHAFLGASVARSQVPLSDGQGLVVRGHGGTTPHAVGSGCEPHYCGSPQWPCANPLQPSGTQPPSMGFCGSGPMGQSSTSRSQEISSGRADWQNSFSRWDHRGSASARGRIREQGGRKIFFVPWGAGSREARWAPPHRRQDLGIHGMVHGSGYAPRKQNPDGCPWGTPETKRWSSGWLERQDSGAEETEPAKAAGEDWEGDYKGSAARGSVLEEVTSSQPNLPAFQGEEDWEKEYEETREPPKSAPAIPSLPEVASKAQTAPLQEKTTPLPPSKDSSFYSYLENLFTDLPKKSSTVSNPRLERQPHEYAAESGIHPPEDGGQHGQVSAELGDFSHPDI